ncbi:MAG TPA: prolipoprotein diacylglyceryl transferase family protein, partial [Gemmatimonadaceae bacterium]|nr:prolipoprotein diacylglyceryl transferase family protein [Gemmatimonadaceae bacterium]
MQKIFASIVHQPLSYDVGPLQLTGFGLAMLLAFVIGQIISQRVLARRGQDPEPFSDVTFAAVIGGLLGGKLYWAIMQGDLGGVFSRAGFTFWGGLMGGIIASYIVIRRKRIPFTRISDAAAPGLA